MAGVPGVLISSVLSGAANRLHDWQLKDFNDAQDRRRQILDYYGKTLDQLSTDPAFNQQRESIIGEIGKVSNLPVEKLPAYKVKTEFSAPPHLTTAQPTPPPMDLSHVVRAVTSGQMPGMDQGSEPSGAGDQTGGATATSAGPAPSAGAPSPAGPAMTPPNMGVAPAALAASEPFMSVPHQMAGLEGPQPTPTPVAQPAGIPLPTDRSAPAPSPMTGMPVGAAAPTATSAPTPAPTPTPVASMGSAPSAPSATPPSPFPGAVELARQKLAMENAERLRMMQQYRAMGMTPQGKPMVDPTRAMALGKTYDPEDPTSDAFGYRNMRPEEYTPDMQVKVARAQATVQAAQARKTLADITARYKTSQMTPGDPLYELHKLTVDLQAKRLDAYLRHTEITDARQQQQFERDTWGSVGGVPVPGAMVTSDGQILGFKAPQVKALTPTEYSKSNADQGKTIIETGNQLIKDINENQQALGAWDGRVNLARKDLGIADPTVRAIYTELRSYAALQPKLHGARGVKYQQEFEDAVGKLKDNPDSVVASVNALNAMAARFVQRPLDTKYVGPGGGGGGPKPGRGTKDQDQIMAEKLTDRHTNAKSGQSIGWSNRQRTWVDWVTHKPIGQ